MIHFQMLFDQLLHCCTPWHHWVRLCLRQPSATILTSLNLPWMVLRPNSTGMMRLWDIPPDCMALAWVVPHHQHWDSVALGPPVASPAPSWMGSCHQHHGSGTIKAPVGFLCHGQLQPGLDVRLSSFPQPGPDCSSRQISFCRQ